MITAFISFYLGGAFYVSVVAAYDPNYEPSLVENICSAAMWPFGLYMIVTGQD